ncbi:flagellin-like protein [Nitratireductor aquibiodomus RA22]|uniref:Flagellin-like protein n=1 Tax=Nitratireductor aquibiodomus RA22 TaxID=1189611 RepID=I5BYN5_9HYPH|nr:flagellin-like protein [Nitratireductor aquibiodomus RA22]
MVALQSLKATNKSMDVVQGRISTGYRVAEASDNAAYWSIATTMRSDNKALSAVQDALGLGAGKIDTSYTAMNNVLEAVDAIKSKLVTARGASAENQARSRPKSKSCLTTSRALLPVQAMQAPTFWQRTIQAIWKSSPPTTALQQARSRSARSRSTLPA